MSWTDEERADIERQRKADSADAYEFGPFDTSFLREPSADAYVMPCGVLGCTFDGLVHTHLVTVATVKL